MKVGDLVKRFDIPGTGTGILYRVIKIDTIVREYAVRRRVNGYNTSVPIKTRKVKLMPAIVMFESKLSSTRANVTHYECDMKVIDVVEMATEYAKLGLLIQDEALRLAGTE